MRYVVTSCLCLAGAALAQDKADDPHAAHRAAAPKAAPAPTGPMQQAGTPATTYRVAIRKDPGDSALAVLTAKQGERVTLFFTTDQRGSVEIHGYQRSVAVTPGAVAKMIVKAEQTGQFHLHLHTPDGRHIPVAVLEVVAK